jgi:Zinc dependent phospholipase C
MTASGDLKKSRSVLISVLLIFLLLLSSSDALRAFSVLTHEAIIDSAWKDSIRSLLLQRFPNSTPDELKEAHAYAYGGSIIQDMGYYPFGSHMFSDLTHYVRTGDFVEALIRDSEDLNEYAFALGSLAHYAADNNGHRIAVNRAVPILYPKLRKNSEMWSRTTRTPQLT